MHEGTAWPRYCPGILNGNYCSRRAMEFPQQSVITAPPAPRNTAHQAPARAPPPDPAATGPPAADLPGQLASSRSFSARQRPCSRWYMAAASSSSPLAIAVIAALTSATDSSARSASSLSR